MFKNDFSQHNARFKLIKNVLHRLKIKIIKLNQITKKNLKIFLLYGPHLHPRGPQNFLSRAAFHSKKLRARGSQIFPFADRNWPAGRSLLTPDQCNNLRFPD